MFSLPDSKRSVPISYQFATKGYVLILWLFSVRREELYSTDSSGVKDSADYPEIEGLLKAEFEGSYGEGCLVSRDNGSGLGDHVGGEEFEFRLFSSTGVPHSKESSQPPIHKVVLRSTSPVNPEPGFIVSERPESYYFANTADREKEFESVAVEGVELLDRAAVRWVSNTLPGPNQECSDNN
jgi:Fungal protein of unknown function (DUF2011)